MKLIFEGKYENDKQYPIGELPKKAKYDAENETQTAVNIQATLFKLHTLIFFESAIIMTVVLHKAITIELILWGVLMAFVAMVLHELLHALCFPKNTTVEMYYSFKKMFMIMVLTAQVSEKRLVFMNTFPNVLLGWLPLFVCVLFPSVPVISNVLLPFAVVNIILGLRDSMNVYNEWLQMPKENKQWKQLRKNS
jgi:hypothetical protein